MVSRQRSPFDAYCALQPKCNHLCALRMHQALTKCAALESLWLPVQCLLAGCLASQLLQHAPCYSSLRPHRSCTVTLFAGAGQTTKLPSGVPRSYKDCNKVDDYPSTPLDISPFQEPFKQAPIKAKQGSTCNGESCLDIYEFDEMYVPDYELLPRDVCPQGTKMLLYDGIFPGHTVVQPLGRQVRLLFLCPATHMRQSELYPWEEVSTSSCSAAIRAESARSLLQTSQMHVSARLLCAVVAAALCTLACLASASPRAHALSRLHACIALVTHAGSLMAVNTVQFLGRFNNRADTEEPGNPYVELERAWGIDKELHNMCEERRARTGNPIPGTGRAMAVHHHGMSSLAPFDGWAEDVHCFGESKDYIQPGNRASMFWFHDHALGTTSENIYAGLEAVHIVRPCSEPYNLQRVPEYVLHFLDIVLDRDCQLVYDKDGAHFDNLWGDINTINGAQHLIAVPRLQDVRSWPFFGSRLPGSLLLLQSKLGETACCMLGTPAQRSTCLQKLPQPTCSAQTAFLMQFNRVTACCSTCNSSTCTCLWQRISCAWSMCAPLMASCACINKLEHCALPLELVQPQLCMACRRRVASDERAAAPRPLPLPQRRPLARPAAQL